MKSFRISCNSFAMHCSTSTWLLLAESTHTNEYAYSNIITISNLFLMMEFYAKLFSFRKLFWILNIFSCKNIFYQKTDDSHYLLFRKKKISNIKLNGFLIFICSSQRIMSFYNIKLCSEICLRILCILSYVFCTTTYFPRKCNGLVILVSIFSVRVK